MLATAKQSNGGEGSTASSRRHVDRGFTLVEILIVVVLIGILATVTVMAIRGTTDRAAENACVNERKSLQTAHESYLLKEDADAVPATGTGMDRFEQSLIDVGILRQVSTNWEMDGAGILTPQVGGVCS